MRALSVTSRLAFMTANHATHRRTPALQPVLFHMAPLAHIAPSTPLTSNTRLRLSSTGNSSPEVTLQNIGREAMEEIVEDYEEGGREESGYVLMDVREPNEIAMTGKVSPNTLTLPLQTIMKHNNVFDMDEDEFEEICGFPKPAPDETLVFTCAAGIRSVHAARFAASSGYGKLVNYMGGAYEWFGP